MGNNVELLLIPQETSPDPEDRLLAALRLFGMTVWPGASDGRRCPEGLRHGGRCRHRRGTADSLPAVVAVRPPGPPPASSLRRCS